MSYLSLVESFSQRTIFWPPESFVLGGDDRVTEWCETVLYQNEDFKCLVKSAETLNINKIFEDIRNHSDLLLAKCILKFWLVKMYHMFAEQEPICVENADVLCEITDMMHVPMPWHPKKGIFLVTMNSADVITRLTLDSILDLNRDECMHYKAATMQYLHDNIDNTLVFTANQILSALTKRLETL